MTLRTDCRSGVGSAGGSADQIAAPQAMTCRVFLRPVRVASADCSAPRPLLLASGDLAALFDRAGRLAEARRAAQEELRRRAEAARARFSCD